MKQEHLRKKIYDIITYHGDDGTSGYALSDEQVEQIVDLFPQEGGENHSGEATKMVQTTTSHNAKDTVYIKAPDFHEPVHTISQSVSEPSEGWEERFIKKFEQVEFLEDIRYFLQAEISSSYSQGREDMERKVREEVQNLSYNCDRDDDFAYVKLSDVMDIIQKQ